MMKWLCRFNRHSWFDGAFVELLPAGSIKVTPYRECLYCDEVRMLPTQMFIQCDKVVDD